MAKSTRRHPYASALRKLLAATAVTVEHEGIVGRSLTAFETGTADFSDYFILESSRAAGASAVLTFDKTFARVSGVELVLEA